MYQDSCACYVKQQKQCQYFFGIPLSIFHEVLFLVTVTSWSDFLYWFAFQCYFEAKSAVYVVCCWVLIMLSPYTQDDKHSIYLDR